ncbi:hypothetical protein [Microbacterium aureliae]
MTTGLALEFEDVFAGRPEALEPRARALAAAADAITRAADALRDLVDDQRSRATDELAGSAADAASALRRAHGRYAGTASALTTFAVELAPIQQQARTAVDDAEYHQARELRLRDEADDLHIAIVRAEADGSPTDALYTELSAATGAAGFSAGQVAEARRLLSEARRDIHDAAERAIDAIETAIEDGADSWRDDWDQFWDGVGDVLSAVGEWASKVLATVVDALKEVLSALVSALVVVLMVIAAALLIGVAFLLLGPIGMLVLGALLASAILALAIAEVLRDPRRVAERNETTAPTGDADEDRRSDAREARDYRDLMAQLALQDAAGGEDATEIRVVAVRNAAGEIVSWRVQLPSTQNWSLTNTGGALNDARTDAMLSLFPGVPTQYEEAVWDAMTRAGVFESEAPIMFTGWSLGGMMAGELATNPRVEGRVQSVFTAGSAIDKHYSDMPDGVRVTQINNGLDPVHTLEFLGLDPLDAVRVDDDWQTHRPLTWPVHDAGMYGAEAERHLPEPRRGDEIFFAEAGGAGWEDVYVADYTRGS